MMRTAFLALGTGLLMFALGTATAQSIPTTASLAPVIPACPEDAVIVGEGNFVNGRWDSYTCGHAMDDLVIGGIGQPLEGER